jgi:hypothetical protein
VLPCPATYGYNKWLHIATCSHPHPGVAGEAQALDVEVDKLHDGEVEEALQQLRFAHTQILAGYDTIRDLRRGLS